MNPRVDVIVPCYNYGHVLEDCVTSILAQQDVDVRVMIMDDASTDSTEEVGSRLAEEDPRVEYRRHAVNRGHIATYNEALAMLSGEFVLLLSADDMLTSAALRRATTVMLAHPEVGFVYGPDIPFRHAPPVDAAPMPAFCTHRIMSYLEFLERSCRLGHTPIQAPTILVRTSLHKKIGDYLPSLPHTADTEIWLRMAAHAGTVCEVNAPQAFRRLHEKNMSLDYSPVRRLVEQKKAFDIHFAAFLGARPEIAPLQAVVARSIGEGAFWAGALAFDDGRAAVCRDFLAFAAQVHPEIQSLPAWRKLRLKRLVGAPVWRRLAPLLSRGKALPAPRPIFAPPRPGFGTK
jgi:glycosyltransferase involved in cell wall biosynthesis